MKTDMNINISARQDTPDQSLQILLLSQKGDAGAFRELVETYHGYAFSLAVRFLGNEEDANDVVQESFIRVWYHLPAFDFRCKFTTWMYRIVINLCHDRARVQNRQNKHVVDEFPAHFADGVNLEDKSIKEDLVRVITALASELASRQREVFVLRDLQDLSIDEVSQVLGVSKGSVKSNLSHARKNIRQRLLQLETKNKRGKNEA